MPWLLLGACGLAGMQAQALDVKLLARDGEGVERKPAAITTGVPFAKGAVTNVAKLAARVQGKAVPAQFLKTVPWEDGSVRWALMDLQAPVPAGGATEVVVSDGGGNPAPASPVQVTDTPDRLKVSTGPLAFTLNKAKFNLFESLLVDGKEQLTAAGRGLLLLKSGGATNYPFGGEVTAGAPTEVKVEQAGPLRVLVCAKGKFPGVHNDLLAYTVRITAYAGQKFLKVQVWLENNGALGYYFQDKPNPTVPEWFAFKGFAVDLGLAGGSDLAAACEGVATNGSLKVTQICLQGRKKAERPGLTINTYADLDYSITSRGAVLKKGDRTDGVVTLRGPSSALTVAVRDFWQNNEKSIEYDAGALRIWLWPTEGRWPRIDLERATWDGQPVPGTHETPATPKPIVGPYYLLAGSTHKGHEFILDFSGRSTSEAQAELCAPVRALPAAAYLAATEAAGLIAPVGVKSADDDCNAKLAAWERMGRSATDPTNSANIYLAQKVAIEDGGYGRCAADGFGWMDFGDLPLPSMGPVGLHYDWTRVVLLNALRYGDLRALTFGAQMARHRIDIDQHWSDRDLPYARTGQRESGFPCAHNKLLRWVPWGGRSWIGGAELYYMLTGEPKALECCQRTGEGLKALNPAGSIEGTALMCSSYASVYRLTGERRWIDDAVKLFTNSLQGRIANYGPFLHNPRAQFQSQDYLGEDMQYCYSLATFCDLHYESGSEAVFKLLKGACDQPFPESFFDAPIFLADLYGYVGWRTGDRALLDRAVESFADGFVESRCPPVFLPRNSTWTRTAAMQLQADQLFQVALWRMGAAGK